MRKSIIEAVGNRTSCKRGHVRISVIIPEEAFNEIKAAAILNEREIPAEIRFRLKQTLEARA